MTNTQRTAVVFACLVMAGALAIAGVLSDHTGAPAYIGGFGTLTGTVLGYTFGRTNGEKALAGAIVTAAANGTAQRAVDAAVNVVTPGGTVAPPASGEGD